MNLNEPSIKYLLDIANSYVEKFKTNRNDDTTLEAPADAIINFDTETYMQNQYDTAVAYIKKYDNPVTNNEKEMESESDLKLPADRITDMGGGRHRSKPSKKRSTRRRRSSKRKSRKVNNRRK